MRARQEMSGETYCDLFSYKMRLGSVRYSFQIVCSFTVAVVEALPLQLVGHRRCRYHSVELIQL